MKCPAFFAATLPTILGVLIGGTAVSAALPPERTLTVDAVELVSGREVPGKPEFTIEHGGIEYRFATSESKAAFAKEPTKYEVADGGACGSMGPLSGLGDARRYAVHAGRIYFFASDGCRERFLKNPDQHIETDDAKVFGSHEQVLKGRVTLDRFVAWAGGTERLHAMTTFRATASRKVKQGEKEWTVTNETAILFPDRYYQKEAWNESWYSTAAGPDGGEMASRRGVEPIAASRCRAFNRSLARWPIVIAKAYVDGAPKADCPGLIVIGDGEGAINGVTVEFVNVWLNGAASRLAIDKADGRPVQLSFRGRDGTTKVGSSVRTFAKPATVDGITTPTSYTVAFDGKELASAGATIDVIEVNQPLSVDLFKSSK